MFVNYFLMFVVNKYILIILTGQGILAKTYLRKINRAKILEKVS